MLHHTNQAARYGLAARGVAYSQAVDAIHGARLARISGAPAGSVIKMLRRAAIARTAFGGLRTDVLGNDPHAKDAR